jgi:hypothetical protein
MLDDAALVFIILKTAVHSSKVPGSRLLLLKYLRKNRYSAEISR